MKVSLYRVKRAVRSFQQDIPQLNLISIYLGVIVVVVGVLTVAGFSHPEYTMEWRMSAIQTVATVGAMFSLITLTAEYNAKMVRARELPIDVGIYSNWDVAHEAIHSNTRSLSKTLRFAKQTANAALIIRNNGNRRVDNLKLYIYKKPVEGKDVSYQINPVIRAVTVEPYQAAFLVHIPALLVVDPIQLGLSVTRDTQKTDEERIFDLYIDVVAENSTADKQVAIRIEIPPWGED
jgi:hypothetical protein